MNLQALSGYSQGGCCEARSEPPGYPGGNDGMMGSLSDRTQRACFMLVLLKAWCISKTAVIVDSYDLCKHLGHDASDSGLMVGIIQPGVAIGSISLWRYFNLYPDAWRRHTKKLTQSYFIIETVSAVLYGVVCFYPWADNKEIGWGLLLTSRVIAGIGEGLLCQLGSVTLTKITIPSQLPWTFAWWTILGCAAGALGPLIATVCHVFETAVFGSHSMKPLSVVLTIIWVLLGTWYTCYFPSLEDFRDYTNEEEEVESINDNETQPFVLQPHQPHMPAMPSHTIRGVVIGVSLLCGIARCLIVSGVEVGLPLLLEDKDGYDIRQVGGVLSGTMLAAVPITKLFTVLQEHVAMSVWTAVHVTCAFTFAGSMLMWTVACQIFGGTYCPIWLIMGAGLMYPFAYLADGLIAGVRMRHCLKDGHLLDANNVSLLNDILRYGIARLVGAWATRTVIEAGSQDLFALQQSISCLTLASASLTTLYFAYNFSQKPKAKRLVPEQLEPTLQPELQHMSPGLPPSKPVDNPHTP